MVTTNPETSSLGPRSSLPTSSVTPLLSPPGPGHSPRWLSSPQFHLRSRRTSFPSPLLGSPRACFILGAIISQSLIFLLPTPLSPSLSFWTLRSHFTSRTSARAGEFGGGADVTAGGRGRQQAAESSGLAMGTVRPRFVLFGDSLTQHAYGAAGWGAALQDRYARKADVILRGYSGYNTRWAQYLLPQIFPAESASAPLALATIFFGANDAALPDRSSQKQHVPVEEYKSNLKKIVKAIQASSGSAKVVLITPAPVDEEGRLKYAREVYKENAVTVPERTNEFTGQYAEACKEAAADVGAPVVDLWTNLQRRPDWKALLSDGLHFNEGGNKAVFEELLSVVETAFPELHWEKMAWDFPEHTAIDGGNPGLSFQKASS